MKMNLLLGLLLAVLCCSCRSKEIAMGEVVPVASFTGVQVTGLTITDDGRMFVCFPRWRVAVPYSVLEVNMKTGAGKPYPNADLNTWEIGDEARGNKFICVQSVVAQGPRLYILDTKNPLMQGVVDTPAIYVYNLAANRLERTYLLADSTRKKSYVNDLRIDTVKGKIYLTDSGDPGLIVVDIASGENYRMLDRHPFTTAETDRLMIGDVEYNGKVHADGIALDRRKGILYFHALTGHTLYGIPTDQLISREVDESKIFRKRTPATDGMIMDSRGSLFMGDLERNAVLYMTPNGQGLQTIANTGEIRWPDSFAIYDGFLYFTNSRIYEAVGDITDMEFTVVKTRLPGQ